MKAFFRKDRFEEEEEEEDDEEVDFLNFTMDALPPRRTFQSLSLLQYLEYDAMGILVQIMLFYLGCGTREGIRRGLHKVMEWIVAAHRDVRHCGRCRSCCCGPYGPP